MSIKTALITGAGRPGGLGAHIARRLAELGYTVALHALNNISGARDTAAALGPAHSAHQADLSQDDHARRLIGEVLDAHGRLDVLINNSGTYQAVRSLEMTQEQWDTGLASTVISAYFTTRAALPALRAARGRIILIGDSAAGKITARNLALSYHIGKTGLLMLMHTLARSEARHGVTINMVSPGILENSIDLDTAPPMPSGRFGTLDDIWRAIRPLLDPAADYCTGSHIIVSGGWNL
jgi:NAD(P)-dependent dehydrogenase (short-subunit alcohol dehydrogenase family)